MNPETKLIKSRASLLNLAEQLNSEMRACKRIGTGPRQLPLIKGPYQTGGELIRLQKLGSLQASLRPNLQEKSFVNCPQFRHNVLIQTFLNSFLSSLPPLCYLFATSLPPLLVHIASSDCSNSEEAKRSHRGGFEDLERKIHVCYRVEGGG